MVRFYCLSEIKPPPYHDHATAWNKGLKEALLLGLDAAQRLLGHTYIRGDVDGTDTGGEARYAALQINIFLLGGIVQDGIQSVVGHRDGILQHPAVYQIDLRILLALLQELLPVEFGDDSRFQGLEENLGWRPKQKTVDVEESTSLSREKVRHQLVAMIMVYLHHALQDNSHVVVDLPRLQEQIVFLYLLNG